MRSFLTAFALACLATPLAAASVDASFTVSAFVVSKCAMSGDSVAPNRAALSVDCTPGAGYTVDFDRGTPRNRAASLPAYEVSVPPLAGTGPILATLTY